MLFAGPGGVDGDGGGGGGGGGAVEEGTGEPGDVVLFHGDVGGVVVEFVTIGVEGGYGEVDGALCIVEERVEVELLLVLCHIEGL